MRNTTSARLQTKKAATPRPRAKIAVKAEAEDKDSITAVVSPAPSDPNADIPDFLRGLWVSKVLPTLTHSLYAAASPFGQEFSKNHLFLRHIQTAIELAAPGSTHKVSVKERVFERVSRHHSPVIAPINP